MKIDLKLGTILDKELENDLNSHGFVQMTNAPNNMTNYANDSTILSFYLLSDGTAYLWSINITQDSYVPLNIKIGDNPQSIEEHLKNINYNKKMDSIVEDRKRIVQFYQGEKQVFLHFTNDALTLIQVMMENPTVYRPIGSEVSTKPTWELYQGELKTHWDDTNLLDYMDTTIFFLTEPTKGLDPQKYTINGAVHLFFNKNNANLAMSELSAKSGKEYLYFECRRFSIFLEDVLYNGCPAIVIYDKPTSADGEFECRILDKQKVLENKDIIDAFNTMYSYLNKYYTQVECYEKIKDIEMYFIGNRCLLDSESNGNGSISLKKGDTIIIPEEYMEGNAIPLFVDWIKYKEDAPPAVRVFLNYDSITKYGGKEPHICKLPLSEIKEKWRGEVIIEPHRNWWIVL